MHPVGRLFLLVISGLPGLLLAARAPIRTYTTADGLPTDSANCIVRDSRGFLWLCTFDGLVRFDGYTFVTYGLKDGIPDRNVTAFLETRDGAYWVGTYNGVARFQPEAIGTKRRPFLRYGMPGPEASQHITALAEDRDGVVWCGTREGIFRKLREPEFQAVEIGLPATSWKTRFIQAMAIDRQNSVWAGTEDAGLYRRRPDGTVEHYQGACQTISAVLPDRQGRIWAGSSGGLCLLTPGSGDGGFALTRIYGPHDGLPNIRIRALLERADGEIWAGTEAGIGVLAPGAPHFMPLGAGNGLADVHIRALGADPDDNIWVAATSYLMRIARCGFLTYNTSDGLGGNQVTSIFEDRQGRLCVVNGIRRIVLNRFDGQRFHSVQPLLVRGTKPIHYLGWGTGQIVLQDRRGDWWVPTGEGLCRFSGIQRFEDLARVPPAAVYTRGDGLPGDDIFRVFEDSHGDIWIGTVDTPALTRWQRQTGHFQRAGESDGFRANNPPAAFVEDRAGDLWVGLFWQGLARYRKGRWQMFSSADGVPSGSLWALLVDHRGRLWIGSSTSGLIRVDDPSADAPKFIPCTTQQGLSSDLIWSLAEDRRGQIYIGNRRGIDVLDPEMGRVRHFSSVDGLAGGDLAAAFCDRTGALWFGATLGLSRLLAEPEPGPVAPPVRITAWRAAGVAQPVSALGETTLSGLELGPDQNHLDIEFASLNFRAGSPIRYQYKLEGANPLWEELGEARAIHLDGLAPGFYRFQVRALRDGISTSPPAQIAFRVLPPLWRRWWSISLMFSALAALLYTVYRFRVTQLIETEKVRTRIAMDLHDDIGASLSHIAILSEVARKEAGTDPNPVTQPLARVAEISRELAGSLGDIVWAINPQRDRVGDLVQRMRRFGGDVLNSRNIDFDCVATEDLLDTAIGADLRRQMLLVFKESIHNIARHSGCGRARAELTLRDRQLCLAVSDDGTGFDADARDGGGNGLPSMKKRAEQIGGSLQVKSGRGQGTTILLTIPLPRRYPFRW
jgi:ligand-binding sensor domain-containing protein/signal transduction histidine kinase